MSFIDWLKMTKKQLDLICCQGDIIGVAECFSNSSPDIWKLRCPLGECGMAVNSLNVIQDHVVISLPLRSTKSLRQAGGVELESLNSVTRKIFFESLMSLTVLFECAYNTAVTVSSDQIQVKSSDVSSKILEFGSLRDGFSLDLFVDPAMENSIGLGF